MKNFYRLIQSGCTKFLLTLEENSIDCVVTDPPYGLNFMGKSWDRALPPKEAFREMFRVLKPGALAFVMSSPRQDVLWRMLAMLEDVGFELKQSGIFWVYASGFPKAYDISSNIDEKLGLERKIIKGTPKPIEYSGQFDQRSSNERIKSLPSSDLAKQWDGWKSVAGLKPAVELILMVQKPLSEKTIVDNVLKWGTGAINVDATRIPFQREPYDIGRKCRPNTRGIPAPELYGGYKAHIVNVSEKGRFPANLLVSDNVLEDGKSHKVGNIRGDTYANHPTYHIYGKYNPYTFSGHKGDEGGFSRFFNLDAWFNERVKRLPREVQKTLPFLIVPKASKKERDKGLTGKKGIVEALHGSVDDTLNKRTEGAPSLAVNIHPTVKPLKLMMYLIELGCPPNGIVLDPFLGSGTTMIATKILGRSCIGIEIKPEYCNIARKRVQCIPTLNEVEYSFEVFGES